MKSNSLTRKIAFVLVVLYAGITNITFSQLPASLEKEVIQFYSDIYNALKIIDTQNEKDAVKKLGEIKPKLTQEAESLSAKLNKIPELTEAEDDAMTQRMMEKEVFNDMMALLVNPAYIQKIENSPALQREYEELMLLMDLDVGAEEEQPALTASQACSFVVGTGSPNSGTYVVSALEDEAFAYNDFENEQFVIEIHEEAYIDIMLIIEKPMLGKHPFTMEMQVAIDLSKNGGDDYIGFDNYQEEGGGFIQIDRLDDIDGIVSGSFSGLFNDSSTEDDNPVEIEGRFSVKRM
ncbi:MAG: hypothetical protein IMY68_01650 [Bacteroidetes bacterium]|nr:hypothetical protein [Bacteroidota bacterium]